MIASFHKLGSRWGLLFLPSMHLIEDFVKSLSSNLRLNGIDEAPPPTLFCLVRVSATECNVFFPILDLVPLYSLVGREGKVKCIYSSSPPSTRVPHLESRSGRGTHY